MGYAANSTSKLAIPGKSSELSSHSPTTCLTLTESGPSVCLWEEWGPRLQKAAFLSFPSRSPSSYSYFNWKRHSPPRVPWNFSPKSGFSWETMTISWWLHRAEKRWSSCALVNNFNKTAILWYNSHSTPFTYLKSMIRWLLVYSKLRLLPPPWILGHFHCLKKKRCAH